MNSFNLKFKIEKYKIYENKFWIWSLRPASPTIGSSILSLKRECERFSNLTKEEFIGLEEIVKIIEMSLKDTFNYDVLNYLMLMMFDKQVHFHVFPRYKNSIFYNEEEWVDYDWPKIPDLMGDEIKDELAKKIIKSIKKHIKKEKWN